jgi:hypothetical protein
MWQSLSPKGVIPSTPTLNAGVEGILPNTKKDSGQAGMTVKKSAQLRSYYQHTVSLQTIVFPQKYSDG